MEEEYEKIKREIEISGRAEQKRYMEEYTAGLSNIEEDLRTPEICMEAVKKNGTALSAVPENLITNEMCMEAVKNNGLALQYVPLITKDLCEEAIKNTGSALQYVPKE